MKGKKKRQKTNQKTRQKLSIVADIREKNSSVIAELASLNVPFEIESLKVADYLVADVAIERKTVRDFVSSLISKRLFRQLADMKAGFKRCLLLVEGDWHETGFNLNAIRGMLLATLLEYNVPVLFSRDESETATFLALLAKRLGKPVRPVSLKAKRKAFTLAETQRFLLESLPGIGPCLSRKLLQRFKTPLAVFKASSSELASKVKLLGKKKAAAIRRVLESKFRE